MKKIYTSIISMNPKSNQCYNLLNELNDDFFDKSIINAVNGKKLIAEEYFSLFQCESSKKKGRKFLSPSELGCLLSHKKTLETFLDSDSDLLIVLEDDVSLIKNLKETIDILKTLNVNDNSVYILGGQDGLSSRKRLIINKNHKVIFGTDRFIYRTCCYMLNRNLAVSILKYMKNKRYMADDWHLLKKNTILDNMYFVELFSHPTDLSNSSIELEREFLK